METKPKHRYGNFTSSNIWRLMTTGKDKSQFGKPALTYIQETKWERRLGRPINITKDSNATLWGKLLEPMVNDLLPIEYRLVSKTRFQHPEIENWSGMPDLITPDLVGDIKCPEPKAFMALLEIFEAKDVAKLKDESPDYYWQLVSNGVLVNRDKAELIIFMPKEIRLPEIRTLCENSEDVEKMKRIYYASPESLALLPDECDISELNKFAFDIPVEDKEALKMKVIEANKLLNNQ